MRILVKAVLSTELTLPINYHHILQAIIYKALGSSLGYGEYLHDGGFLYESRQFKLFTFSLLKGKYQVRGKTISFEDEVSFEVSSPDIFMIRMVMDRFGEQGIDFGSAHINDLEIYASDETVESSVAYAKMLSPICVYSTDRETGKTIFYTPWDAKFAELISDNFVRKYKACFGIFPDDGIFIEPVQVDNRNKYVTNYKNFYISGWMGTYKLFGERKYLDFIFQTGLGSKNSQGFGMWEKDPRYGEA